MPNRILNEGICTSDRIASLTDFEFRLWACLLTIVDDAGRGDARPAIIKGRCFALLEKVTAKDVDTDLHGLAAKGCVSLYTVGNMQFYEISDWGKLQPDAGRRTTDYKMWRKAVFERDNYTCQICGKRGGRLNAHHIERYRDCVSKRTDVSNGITVCESCHKNIHHVEGK